jgi:hypothetical protein
MTLKEKFIDAFKIGRRFDIQNAETIADDYAIEFAEWVLNRSLGEIGLKLKDDTLDKFKKEKGL